MANGSKTAEMLPGYQCPKLVDNNNWMDGHTWPDKFSIDQTMNEIKVSRMGDYKYWGMNLRFQCCKGKRSKLLFLFHLFLNLF